MIVIITWTELLNWFGVGHFNQQRKSLFEAYRFIYLVCLLCGLLNMRNILIHDSEPRLKDWTFAFRQGK